MTNRKERRAAEKQKEKRTETGQKMADLINQASVAMQAQNPLQAAQIMQQAVALSPNDPQLNYLLGNMLVKAGKSQDAIAPLKKAATGPQRTAEAIKELATALKNTGKEEESVPLLQEALALKPDYVDAHFTLAMIARKKPDLNIDMEAINESLKDKEVLVNAYIGILEILRSRKQLEEATVCQEELCSLDPDNAFHMLDFGWLLSAMNSTYKARAGHWLAKAVKKNPSDAVAKSIFSSLMRRAYPTRFDPLIKDAILYCFEKKFEANFDALFGAWGNFLTLDPENKSFASARIFSSEDEFDSWISSINEENSPWLKSAFMTGGLKYLVISDLLLETLLTRIRRYLCIHHDKLSQSNKMKIFETFITALAEQCYLNEFVYTQTPEESEKIATLIDTLKAKLSSNDDGDGLRTAIALTACYIPLAQSFTDHENALDKLAHDNPAFASLVKVQFKDPMEEQAIKKTIPVFGDFANEISKNVRQQYEENPYPRWTGMSLVPTAMDDIPTNRGQKNERYNILVAGCGTGRHALSAYARYPNANITAIDLSQSSLAYAIRKAREAGVTNRIKFIHADILSMADWPDEFDIIECSGVLHHMEDPFRGWQILNDKLKPGGFFKVGLYSERAREQIAAARNYIAEHKIPATPEGIRSFRQIMFDRPVSDPMRQRLLKTADFYTTSIVRDLVFHVQEHRMTLPQIKGMAEKLGLVCLRFVTDSHVPMNTYEKMFPTDPLKNNFDHWHELEQKHPDTFMSMYQFWCQKIK